MDLRRIRHFLVLAETLNFHKAAEKLHIAQPPLSVSIQKLEAELGLRLFERTPKGVSLTQEGKQIHADAMRLLHFAEQLQHTADEIKEGTRGVLHIGFVGSVTQGLLQNLVQAFRQKYENVELNFTEGISSRIVQDVEAGKLDVGLIRTPVLDDTAVDMIQLEKDNFVLAVPKRHELEGRSVCLKELADYPFIVYSPDYARGLHHAVMSACQGAGFIPRVVQIAIQVDTVLALVESGVGIALVPSVVMQTKLKKNLAYLKLLDESDIRRIGFALIHKKNTATIATIKFLDLAISLYS
ncbi:LysR family transcriptional regulator [Advenella faeciporci]|uniref:LysR family transcriptional regulator n=1 Tax=Advenella faeciporci TaxID=797535 RepID=A0A918MX16_9BURK|nr:LysR family transcriptional regulator [Advenella faeciporci]GGW80211.1 LysR family transcriptional regulator [Advenella faeciporci]